MRAREGAAFLDTSYVVRYLTADPPDMAEQAARVIDSEQPLVLSEMVLLESAYVLTTVYSVPRADLVDSLMDLIQRHNLKLAQLRKPAALEALRLCRNSKRTSFTDALLWAQARESGIERLYTFDRRFPAEGLTLISGDPS
jgi:predicted nucleic acid-binding protein